jgi:hypothetical protein
MVSSKNHNNANTSLSLRRDNNDVAVHVHRVRQYLWTVTTNGPIAHPQVMYEHEEPWKNDYWQGKTEEFGEKPVPLPLCPPKIPQELTTASAVMGQ